MRRRRAACLLAMLLISVSSFAEQLEHPCAGPDKPKNCAEVDALRKCEWGLTDHFWLTNLLHKESVDIRSTWCKVNAPGGKRVSEWEDFGRTVFTGQGLHPTLGSIVPGSGFAAGASFGLERASASHPVRYHGVLEVRGTLSSFLAARATLDILGSGNREDNRHVHAVLSAIHRKLPQLTYFGLGNTSELANESVYGLEDTNVTSQIDIPLPRGLMMSGALGGLWSTPQGSYDADVPSIEVNFTPSDTPALQTKTSYIYYGGQLRYQYPMDESIRGYRTDLRAAILGFHDASGNSLNFNRFEIEWAQRFAPGRSDAFGTFSLDARFSGSVTNNGKEVPFYLQPTLGGTDIEGRDVLRSFRDYRFRAPNVADLRAEYEHTLWGPIGALLFYDTGNVALSRHDLTLHDFRHSFGVGFTLKTGGIPLVKLYYAFAGGEGTHTTFTGNTNNFLGEGDPGRIF